MNQKRKARTLALTSFSMLYFVAHWCISSQVAPQQSLFPLIASNINIMAFIFSIGSFFQHSRATSLPSLLDNNRHIEILQALAAGTDPVTGEVFPADSPYNQPEIIRALFFALNELRAVAEKGNQGLAWTEEEDELLAERFNEGTKITQLAKLHSRTYGAIKARLIKLELLQK